MSERRGFFARLFGGSGEDEDGTRIYSPGEVSLGEERKALPPREIEQHPHGFTVERAAEIINDLPPDVSKESAVRIVRGTLAAAGIRFEDLERSTRARETRLRSEIDLARGRQEELRGRTEKVVRSLEEEIARARQACENGVTEEEERVSRANSGLEDIQRVRGFFGFPGADVEETTEGRQDAPVGDETQVFDAFDADQTQVLRRPGERPLSDPNGITGER